MDWFSNVFNDPITIIPHMKNSWYIYWRTFFSVYLFWKGYGKGYKYPHGHSDAGDQIYLPDSLLGVNFFKKTSRWRERPLVYIYERRSCDMPGWVILTPPRGEPLI